MTTDDDRKAARATSREDGPSHAPLLDEAAFQLAFEQHGSAVHRYASARVGPEAAEEVLAETFVAAWRARARFVDSAGSGLEAWLIGVATHIVARHRRAEHRWLKMCADTLHAQERQLRADDDADGIDQRLDAAMRSRQLGAALAHIPRRERDPLLLHILQDMSYEDIARALEIPLGTVRSRISRGRQRLADRIGGDDRG